MEDRQRSGLGWGVFLWKKVGFEDIIYIRHVYKKESALIYEKV